MKISLKCATATLALFLIYCVPAFAEKKEITAEGKYVMGDLDSKKDAKTLALMEAKRMALEKSGTYIESVSEVKNYQLTKDQVNSLAAGIMSVEVVKEDWKMSGENMVLLISIRATIDTSNLQKRMAEMQDVQSSEPNKEIQNQLAALQKELADLKREQAALKEKTLPKAEVKEKHEDIMKKIAALDYLERGNSLLRVQRWNDAIAVYRQALAVNPKLADAYAGMSFALEQTGQTEKALAAANAAQKMNPKSAFGHMAMAKILYDQKKYDNALASINRAIELWANSSYYYLLRGDIYMKLRNREPARKDFDRACKMQLPPACQRSASEYREDGSAALRAQRWNEAIELYKQALAQDPKQADAYAGMSFALERTGQTEKAIEAANTARQINPKSAFGHMAMARILYDQEKYDNALTSINRAIELWTKSSYYYLLRGDIYVKLRNAELARRDFDQACKMGVSEACRKAKVQ
jgi:tetratricopeptide (TPR) repeat protein